MDTDINTITGKHEITKKRTINYPIDRFEIEVELSSDGKFIGILKVKVNKKFLNYSQKQSSSGYLDVDQYYRDYDIE